MMKKKALWACVVASLVLTGCSIFKQPVDQPDQKQGAQAEKPANVSKPAVATPKPKPPANVVSSTTKPNGSAETPDVYLKDWIKKDSNKASLQAWLKKKPAAPQDIDKFLSESRYKDLRYEAYFDLVGSK